MPDPLVISVILNTNRREDTLECLASLGRSSYPNHKIIVLDNHSTDGSVEAIRENYPLVEIIAIEVNLGYAGNNNVGLERAVACGAEWVFVLNEDTVLDPDCLSLLVEAGDQSPDIGIVGPMVYHFDEPDIIQSGGGMLGKYWQSIHLFKDEPDRGQVREPHEVEWISGCAILVRRQVIEDVGMFDPRFFYYWEETEWCLRSGRAGWRIVHVPKAKIWHKGVQRNYSPKPSLIYYRTRNRLLTLSKHHAPFQVKFVAWLEILRTLVSWSVRPKWRDQRLFRNAMWAGAVDFLYGRWGKQGS